MILNLHLKGKKLQLDFFALISYILFSHNMEIFSIRYFIFRLPTSSCIGYTSFLHEKRAIIRLLLDL